MSLKVEVSDLADKASEYGPGFLLTADGKTGPHAMHVQFGFSSDGDVVASCAIGRSAASNIEANPYVTLLWPPQEDGGFSLIADGKARVSSDAESTTANITMLVAVLHRHA